MRKFIVTLFLLFCFTSVIYGQKTRFRQIPEKLNPADYPVEVHISATHIQSHCSDDANIFPYCCRLFAEVTASGKKLEALGWDHNREVQTCALGSRRLQGTTHQKCQGRERVR